MLLRRKIVVLGVLVSSVAGFSNAFGGGMVSQAYVFAITAQEYGGTGQFFVSVNQPITGGPSCAIQPMKFVINASTDAGKAQIATVLAAQSASRPISILGTGSCDVWGDTETVFWVQF
jgi:hypothetical protein